jgi:glycosyltransferase involved in cell wall biosynthesis
MTTRLGYYMDLMLRRKLLVCLPYLTPSIGGGAMVLANLLTPLTENGFDLHVIYFQERAKQLIPPGIPSDALLKRVGALWNYLEYPAMIRALAAVVARERPDAILCNSYQPFWMCLAALKLSGMKIPILHGEQNNLTEMFRGVRFGALRSFLTRLFENRAARVVVPAEGLRAPLAADFGVDPAKILLIPNPIALDRIAALSGEPVNHPWFRNKDRPIILNVGVLDEQKDQATLLRAVAALKKKSPVRCVFVGEGPLREDLERTARDLGIAEDVAFVGFQSNPFRFMARADVFALSSRYEGFGLVVAEAMACGCPVVSTRCPYGPEEIVADGKTGLLVSGGDAEALAQALSRVLSDAALKKSLVAAGHLRAQDFAPTRVAAQYAQVLREIMSVSGLRGRP